MDWSAGSHHDEQTFEDLRLEDHRFADLELSECTFRKLVAPRSSWTGCGLSACVFEDCDLAMARLERARLHDVVFRRCKLIGVDWTQASTLIMQVRFEDCALDYGNFAGLELPGLHLLDCSAREVDFRDARLDRACFRGSRLHDSLFEKTSLRGADLSEALDYRIDPRKNKLGKTRFSLDAALELLRGQGILVGPKEERK